MKKNLKLICLMSALSMCILAPIACTDDREKDFVKETCVVTFVYEENLSKDVKVDKGTAITEPADDETDKTDFTFDGWFVYSSLDKTEKYDFSKAVNRDITLFAKYTAVVKPPPPAKTYTITVEDGYGGTLTTLTVKEGKTKDLGEFDYPYEYSWAYEFGGFAVNGVEIDTETYTYSGDTTVSAVWKYLADTPEHYDFTEVTEDDTVVGYAMAVKSGVILAGRVALPSSYEGKPVVALNGNWIHQGYTDPYYGDPVEKLEMVVPDSVKRFDSKMLFFGCDFKKIYIGTGLEYIDPFALYQTDFAAYFVHPNNEYFKVVNTNMLVTMDGKTLVSTTRCVEELVVPDAIKVVYPCLMHSSPSLKSVVFEGAIDEIMPGAFSGCGVLTSIKFKKTVRKIADSDMSKPYPCDGVFSFLWTFDGGSIELPGIEYLGTGAFTATKAASIKLDKSITHISGEAFAECMQLESIGFIGGGTASTDGRYVIAGNTVIEKNGSDTLLADNKTKGDRFIVFAAASDTTSYAVPETIRSFDPGAFAYAENLTTVTLPSAGITQLPEGLFMKSGLTSITIPKGVTRLSSEKEYWGDLMMIEPMGVFYECPLTSVVFEDVSALEFIGDFTFNGNKCRSIALPASLTQIGEDALTSDTLESITVPQSSAAFKSVDGVLYNKAETELIIYPSAKAGAEYVAPTSLKIIKSYALNGNLNLSSIILNENLITIENYGMVSCLNVRSVVFPATLETVYDSSFYNLQGLTDIEFRAKTPPEVIEMGFEHTLFNVFNANSLEITVAEEYYDDYFRWINAWSDNYGNNIVTTSYEFGTTYNFYSEGELLKSVKSRVYNVMPIPERTGKFFHGWFFRNGGAAGDWGSEAFFPMDYEDNMVVNLYAKWGDEPRVDGSSPLFAYTLIVDEKLTFTLTQPTVFFQLHLDAGFYDVYVDDEYLDYLFVIADAETTFNLTFEESAVGKEITVEIRSNV